MFPTTAISFEGDDVDRASLRELARRRKTTVGKLTKAAIERAYGDELAILRPFFAANGVSYGKQSARSGK